MAPRWFIFLSIFSPLISLSEAWGACVPSFPYKNGWLGGDAAYSIPLAKGRVLWLFGDTFVGRADARDRAGSHMVGNTIAVSECSRDRFSIAYAWGRRFGAHPRAFFEPPPADNPDGKVRFWPQDGFVHGGRLYVFLSKVRTTDKEGPFAFEYIGVRLAEIPNPASPPQQWKISYRPVTDKKGAIPGVSVTVQGRFALLLTFAGGMSRSMILTRLPLDSLDAPAERLQVLTNSGEWKTGQDWSLAKEVMQKGHTEMTVRLHRRLGKWVAVQPDPVFMSPATVVRVAPAIAGPWTEPLEVYRAPQAQPQFQGYDKDTFCYAGKEHPEFADPNRPLELVLTYACNSTDFWKLGANMGIYRPEVVRVSLPK